MLKIEKLTYAERIVIDSFKIALNFLNFKNLNMTHILNAVKILLLTFAPA